MGLLLKCGNQILGLSLAAAKSEQQLGRSAANKYYHLLTTTTTTTRKSRMINSHHHDRFLGANNKYFSTNTTQNVYNKDIKLHPMRVMKYFAIKIFGRRFFPLPPPPPPPSPVKELLEKFIEMAEESKYCREHRLPRVLDEIRPVLYELLIRWSDKTMVRFVYEFARPAASPSSPPPIVIDSVIKDIVDKLPPPVIHMFQDMMMDLLVSRFDRGTSFNVTIHPNPPKSVVITADVSDIRREHLKVFVIKDKYLMITGPNIDSPPACAALHALRATIHHLIILPVSPYSHDEYTASIFEVEEEEEEDQGQGRRSQLKIVFPVHDKNAEMVVNKPRVFQLNIDTQG